MAQGTLNVLQVARDDGESLIMLVLAAPRAEQVMINGAFQDFFPGTAHAPQSSCPCRAHFEH